MRKLMFLICVAGLFWLGKAPFSALSATPMALSSPLAASDSQASFMSRSAYAQMFNAPLLVNLSTRKKLTLVAFLGAHCPYSVLFRQEVRRITPLNDIYNGLIFRIIDVARQGSGGYGLKQPLKITPSFILFHKGQEVARIEGYPGKNRFFELLRVMVLRAQLLQPHRI